jgi:DNA-binding SARP family transcriptional activator
MLQAFLLGQFDLRGDSKRIAIPSRAGQSLFAFLILNAGTLFRREYLAGQLWENLGEEQARHHLRQELWRVRSALCPLHAYEYLEIDDIEIGFVKAGAYWLDVEAFRKNSAPGSSLTELMTGLALYRGDLMPGFFQDWVLRERQVLTVLFETRMGDLLERLVEREEWSCVLEWAEHWIALYDTPEPAFRALMRAYAALGDHARLAMTFARCQRALRQNLAVEPSAETTALYDELLHASNYARN